MTTTMTITSFGFLHGAPPPAHVVLDLRTHFRDPHVRPELRELTARDPEVVDAVLATPGIRRLIRATATAVLAYREGPSSADIAVAVGCAGGRHRAATVAAEVARALEEAGAPVVLVHRDLHRPVVHR